MVHRRAQPPADLGEPARRPSRRHRPHPAPACSPAADRRNRHARPAA
ncbi:MAG TPA: hypothetical protein PKI03_04150 [Pseudomonadota bacterium]|nr:hypothetical protein [Pseudomonadota bacterium]